MVILLKIVLIIFFLLFLIKLKWDLGIILVLDSILVALLFGLNIKVYSRNFLAASRFGEAYIVSKASVAPRNPGGTIE